MANTYFRTVRELKNYEWKKLTILPPSVQQNVSEQTLQQESSWQHSKIEDRFNDFIDLLVIDEDNNELRDDAILPEKFTIIYIFEEDLDYNGDDDDNSTLDSDSPVYSLYSDDSDNPALTFV